MTKLATATTVRKNKSKVYGCVFVGFNKDQLMVVYTSPIVNQIAMPNYEIRTKI
jgi:hypothetical protein